MADAGEWEFRPVVPPKTRILIFVEDPGAANFVMPLLDDLARAGWETKLMATGPAIPYLADHEIAADDLPRGVTAAACVQATTPDILIVGTSENPDSFAFDLTHEARRAGIRTVGVVDGPANVEHRFRGRGSEPLAHAPDWLLSSDAWTADQFAALGYPRARLVVTGHPHYDAVREEGKALLAAPVRHRRRLLPTAPEDRPVVVFLGEGSDGLGLDMKRRSSDYTLHGWRRSDRRTEIVLEEFLDAVAALDVRPYLVLRAHPKDAPDAYAAYLRHFDTVSAGGRPLPLLCACDLVVGLSTSLLVEAALIGLTTLSILPSDAQRALIPTVRLGLTPCVTDRQALRELLPRLIATGAATQAPVDDAVPWGATARVIEAIGRVIDRSRPLVRRSRTDPGAA